MPPKKRARLRAAAVVEPAVVLCYGDSNTHGADSESSSRLPLSARWTTYLQAALGREVTVVPEGLNGRTTVIDDPQENPDFAGLVRPTLSRRAWDTPASHGLNCANLIVAGG